MERELKKYLEILNTERYIKKPKEAGIILNKITQFFKQEQSQFTLGLLICLLLEEKNAIFTFIWKTCLDFETVPSANAALKLLDFLVNEFEKSTEPCFMLLFEKCLHLLDTKFASVKELSLKLVKNLVMKDSKNSLDLGYLVGKLEKYITEESIISGTVFEQICSILGYLFEKHPESVKGKEKRFFSHICDSLRHEMRFTKNPSASKIKGAFEGINSYLLSYPPPHTETLKEIYGYVKNFSKFRKEKRAASRSALKVFQNHWARFSMFAFNDKDIWREDLSQWMNRNSEDRQCAFNAMNALYNVIAVCVKQDPTHADVVKNYLRDFEETLQSKEFDSYGKRSALAGIKLFVSTDSLEHEDLKKAYLVVMNFARNQDYFPDSSSPFSCCLFLPLCIESVSAFAFKFSNVETMACLQRLCLALINNYPKTEPDFQRHALFALERSFYTLGLCDSGVLEKHIQKVLYQALVRTCSCVTASDLEFLKETEEPLVDCVTSKSYLGMWEYLLNLMRSPNLPLNDSFALKKGVAAKIVDAFIESFVKIMEKLNLNVKINRTAGTETEAEVETPSDVNIFINCVDLYLDLIPLIDSYTLSKWLIFIFQTVTRLSRKNPLIAGFYKILTTTFKVADDLQFFEGGNKKLKIFHFLSKFVEEVLMKIDQYKGELQVVCLQTLLAAPVPLIEPFVEKTVAALEVAVHLGRSHFPLLRNLVDALERWDFHLPRATTSTVMRRILPHFDLFFQSQYFRGNNLVGSSVEGRRLKKKLVFNDSELLMLQKKFLMFIGNLDMSMAMNLIELPQMPEEERKITDKRLCYLPPSGNIQLELEGILARVMELAVSCSDRRTRIASCELLYAAVMIVLSNVNQMSGGYSGLFRKIIKTCLVLASDSDSVVYQIFEPLMFQIVRYFSNKKTMYFTETQDVVDILTDFVTLPYDPTARDLSALLICQFTTWSIRQLAPEELAVSPESINKVLGNVYSLSVHPSFSKRLGAAVVFNKIYPVLREEDYILNANWFQLFYHFMESLRLCSGAEDVTEITEAIQHVKRPLVEMADEFNKVSQARVVPPEFEGGLLSHLVKWTLTRCCDSTPLVRRVSLSLVEELAPLVTDCGSLVSFTDKHFPGKSLLIKEKSFDPFNPTEEYLVDWLNHQTTFFEYYLWLLDQKIFSADDVPLSEFNNKCENFVVGVTAEGERSVEVDSSKHESVLAFLNVLLAFKQKAFYFSHQIWDLVKLSVFRPSRLGFDVNPNFVSERLTPVLSNLLEYCYLNLTHYAWNPFYEGFEDLMIVPVLHHITRNQSVGVRSWEFLFSLKIIQSAGMWADFLKRGRFSMDGTLIVEIIFRSLFVREGKVVYAKSLDPSCKAYLEELMTVGARIGVDFKDLAGFLENREEVQEEDTGKTISKGEYFWTQFKHILMQVLGNKSDSLVNRTLGHANADSVNLLIEIMENNQKLSSEVFRRWEDFQRLQNVCPQKVLLDLAVRAAQATKTPGCLTDTAVASFIYSFLENTQFRDMDTEEIERVFNLFAFLPSFCEKADDNPRLKASLSKFLVDNNAIGEAVSQGFSRCNAMGLVMKGLLRGLNLSGSLALLDFILSIGFWFNTFCTRAETEAALSVFAELPPDHSSCALDLAYKACMDSKILCSSMSKLFHWFLLPLMRVSPPAATYEFVVGNLQNFCDLIKVDGLKSLGGVRKITEKIFAAEILQVFFTRAPKEVLSKLPKEKETLIISLVKNFSSFNTKVKLKAAFRERFRKFICQIFNMICAIISAKCTDEKFFRLFVFDEQTSLLYAVVDTSCKYNLSMDFEEIPKRKTFSKALRKSAGVGVSSRSLIKSIQTNTLFTSSLREDVTKFDLFSSSVRPMDSIEGGADPQVVEIELEVDTLNKHECMATVVGIVTKMVVEEITPLPETGQPVRLPCWLQFFLTVLQRRDSMENFILFILKALYNLQDYVRSYAAQVFPVMLEKILSLLATHPMNYVVIDLVEMMIGWKDLPEATINQDRLLQLVELVISKSDSFRKDIINYNLEVIKTIVEKWKDVLATPRLSGFMYERLVRDTRPADDGVAYLNIQVCRILLSNGILPWKEGSERLFFDSVLKCFNEENKNKQVFAEVCGLALNLLPRGSVDELEDLVGVKIFQAASWHSLLYAVHKHYPKITSKFVFQIFSKAWSSNDSLTVRRLEMLHSYVCHLAGAGDAMFDRHAHHFLTDMLNSADAAVQELSLQIADKFLSRLDDEKREAVMKEALRLQKSVDINVRKRVYELAANHYPKHRGEEGVWEQCKVVLLRGLNDPERELEESCLGFWRDFLGSSSPLSTLVKVFREMYTPDTEGIFLSNTVKILIATADAFGDCEKPIFPHPIVHQVKFQKRTLNLSSRRVLPGFMASRVLTNHSLEHVVSLRSETLAFLRPTVSGSKFAPTARGAADGAAPEGEETFKKPEIPKNPKRRRFYRSSEKTSGSFARWQIRKKKKESEEEEEWARKKETQVDVYGEYRAGDYPDIEISHFQILKPLEALAKRDPQVARHFMVSFYSGLVESVSPDEEKTLLAETNACFLRILASSKSFDSGVFGFVFQVLLKHGKGLDVDCERISNAAVSSNWLTLGALLVEQTLASGEHFRVEAKRRKGDETLWEKNWLELAKLYRNLEEFDVLSGIFLDKLNVVGDAREAISAEAVLDWSTASKHYKAVLQEDPDSRRSEFYTESYFSCLAKLSSWSSLNECIRATVDEDLNDLWENYNLLSWFLKSEVMVALDAKRSEFRGVPEELSNTKAKLDVLAANFGEESAVFDWLSGNVLKANYGIDRLCLDFLAGWSHLNKWSYNLRAAKLSEVQAVAELGFAVKSLADRSKSGLEQNIKTGMQRWEKSVPTRWDDLRIWDVKLRYREKFLSELKEFDVTSATVNTNLRLAKAALAQRNIRLAKEVLIRVKGKMAEADTDLKAEYDHCFNLGKMVVAQLKKGDPSARLETYLNVWRSIARQVSSAKETESETSSGLLFRCMSSLGELVSSILPFVKKQEQLSAGVLEPLCDWLKSPPGSLVQTLENKILQYLESAKNISKSLDASAQSTAYLELSRCLLKLSHSDAFPGFEKLGKYLLRAMKLGSPEARQLFGCLLSTSQVVTSDDSFDDLVAESDSVPSWMYLMWLNQILANLNTRLFPLLKAIVSKIAQDYPNAIRFPFRLTRFASVRVEVQFFAKKLSDQLSDSLYENFLISMNYLGPPDLILRSNLESALKEVEKDDFDYSRVKSILTETHQLMFSSIYEKFRGPVFNYWEMFKNPLESLMESREKKEVLRKIRSLAASIETSRAPSKRTHRYLESYSPWLRAFHSLREGAALELPGQYDGSRRPITEHMVTVSCFKNDILLFDSKCRPMRISILGNDAVEHRFLVKFGEDLRQDERIQQVFGHFNYTLNENKQTRRFSVNTYKVIPLTFTLGMIEWIDNNVSLYEMMESSLGNDAELLSRAQAQHLQFLAQGRALGSAGPVDGSVAAHLIAYASVQRELAVTKFKAMVQRFPRDLLRKSFWALSTSPEQFIYLRANFAASHAVMCVTHWLVGIGDRHLQNTLVSTTTGRVLGIDFGYAFGFATQFLAPPELIPFRLTPQILGLLHPLEESGWVKQTMVRCLRLFRKENFGLSSVLEVFALEPVVDWLDQARKSSRCGSENPEIPYAKQKITTVHQKLNGANPTTIFEEDLKAGHSESKYLDKYLEVLAGVEQHNVRARCPREGLTEEDQVACLIDLATDPHVLAKTYVGWNPWL